LNDPYESEWGTISSILTNEVSADVCTVKAVFQHAQSGHKKEPWKHAQGKGWHQKLQPENKGLLAGTPTLTNRGVLPEMDTVTCNESNQSNPKVCKNKLLKTQQAVYTDVASKAIACHTTCWSNDDDIPD
jgi:hypothetical protein